MALQIVKSRSFLLSFFLLKDDPLFNNPQPPVKHPTTDCVTGKTLNASVTLFFFPEPHFYYISILHYLRRCSSVSFCTKPGGKCLLEECELLHQKYRCLQSQVPAGPVTGADSVNSCQDKASLQRD